MSEKKKKLEPALDFSPRQLITMLWWNNPDFQHCLGVIADGAVRSGKTTAIAYGFLLWSMSTFDGYNFGLCGKTIRSFERNVLWIYMEGILEIVPKQIIGILIRNEKTRRDREHNASD